MKNFNYGNFNIISFWLRDISSIIGHFIPIKN